MSDSDYNIYNDYDPKFINYAELYKSPQEMEIPSQDLINQYANALMIQDENCDVYINNPELVGNRYFINTKTECLDSESKTHTRSVLVDNINESAMATTEEGRKGLMYSLLASLKLVNSDDMFADNTDGKPTPYYKKTRDKDGNYIPMLPYCKQVSVKTDADGTRSRCGYVLETDEIDPAALNDNLNDCAGNTEGVEGFMDMPQINVGSDIGGVEDVDALVQTTFDNVNAMSQATVESQQEAEAEANAAIAEVNKQRDGELASAGGVPNAIAEANANAKESAESSAKSMNQRTNDRTLLRATNRFLELDETKAMNTLELFKQLINTQYICGENTEIRIPSKCVKAIFDDISNEEIDSIDAKRTDLCDPIYNRKLSFSNFIEQTMQDIDNNKDNKNELPLSGLPLPTVCIKKRERRGGFLGMGGGWRTVRREVASSDYEYYIGIIDRYRAAIALEITRYSDVFAYGHCSAVEGFQTIETPSWFDFTALLYVISLLFIFFYMIYRFMYKFFDFKGKIKLFSKKK